jgi:hypothetical protein
MVHAVPVDKDNFVNDLMARDRNELDNMCYSEDLSHCGSFEPSDPVMNTDLEDDDYADGDAGAGEDENDDADDDAPCDVEISDEGELEDSTPNNSSLTELGGLERRGWNEKNKFGFYLKTWSWTNCAFVCETISGERVARRDHCHESACDDQTLMKGWDVGKGLCNKAFTACKKNGNRWNLKIKGNGRNGQCSSPMSITYPRNRSWQGKKYGSLHDRGKNDKKVGTCWVERKNLYVKRCGPYPYTMQSVVWCRWT